MGLALVIAPDFAAQVLGIDSQVSSRAPSESSIVEVVDGDTVKVFLNGKTETTRLLAIDTPETKHPDKGVECFGQEASTKLTELLPMGTKVNLSYDQEQGERDRYGRLLVYLSTENSVDINAKMVKDGYAYVYRQAPADRRGAYELLEKEARLAERGLWAATTCGGRR